MTEIVIIIIIIITPVDLIPSCSDASGTTSTESSVRLRGR
jgi:hypothetical protein